MFKEMRRSDRELTKEKMLEIMHTAEYGILSTISENGYPYGVAVNFLFCETPGETGIKGSIYFHCALEGHKLDNIALNNKVSFCVVADVSLLPEDFTTNYSSVIAFGKAYEVPNDDEKLNGERQEILIKLMEKFSKDHMEAGLKYIKNSGPKAKLFKIEIEHMTAKGK